MNRMAMLLVTGAVFAGLLWLPSAFAQQKAPPPDFAKNAFKMVLSQADKNADGKLSMEECYAMWKDRAIAEKNCSYWDADGDGIITEDEYINRAMKKMQ
jgi:hypothetical protein